MSRHLLIRLASPLIAFGGETIDNFGVIRDFPALSMVTGLIANALGWDRGDDVSHNRLQARLRAGTRLELPSRKFRDYQTAQLFEDDCGWTSHGAPEGRAKSPSYSIGIDGRKSLTLQRYRDYHADLTALVALRLEPADEPPSLDNIALALDRPKRPLFIGRKPCLPTTRLMAGWIDANTVLQALQTAAMPQGSVALRVQWPDGEGELAGDRVLDVCDERNWTSGVHGGWRPVREGVIQAAARPA
jgi:CRISPR system Cascade subunit CasD